jgi:hypothetical protein
MKDEPMSRSRVAKRGCRVDEDGFEYLIKDEGSYEEEGEDQYEH